MIREGVHQVPGGGMAWRWGSHAVLRGSAAIQRMRPLWHTGQRSSGGAAAVDSAIWQASVAGPECPAWVAAIKARHRAIFACRVRLAKMPKYRMRTKPLGSR